MFLFCLLHLGYSNSLGMKVFPQVGVFKCTPIQDFNRDVVGLYEIVFSVNGCTVQLMLVPQDKLFKILSLKIYYKVDSNAHIYFVYWKDFQAHWNNLVVSDLALSFPSLCVQYILNEFLHFIRMLFGVLTTQ